MIKKITAILILASFLLVGYKYFEFKTLSSLVNLHSESLTKEISTLDKYEKDTVDFDKDIMFALGVSGAPDTKNKNASKTGTKSQSELSENGISAVNIEKEKINQYKKILQENQESYERLKERTRFLIGARSKFSTGLINDQLEYYRMDNRTVSDNLIGLDIISNLLKIYEDWSAINSFTTATGNVNKNYPKHFKLIASLEKYTRSEHRFVGEDQIKEKNPRGYEMLNRNREYFNIYYLVVKDYVEGDYESGNYKLTKLNSITANFNFDFKEIFSENDDSTKENSKAIARNMLERVRLIKDFERSDLGRYPLVGRVGKWKSDLLLCDSYAFRAGIYKEIANKYITAKNHEDLLKEFSKAGIQVEDVDKQFDSTRLEISEDKDKIVFTCIDSQTGDRYDNTIVKN